MLDKTPKGKFIAMKFKKWWEGITTMTTTNTTAAFTSDDGDDDKGGNGNSSGQQDTPLLWQRVSRVALGQRYWKMALVQIYRDDTNLYNLVKDSQILTVLPPNVSSGRMLQTVCIHVPGQHIVDALKDNPGWQNIVSCRFIQALKQECYLNFTTTPFEVDIVNYYYHRNQQQQQQSPRLLFDKTTTIVPTTPTSGPVAAVATSGKEGDECDCSSCVGSGNNKRHRLLIEAAIRLKVNDDYMARLCAMPTGAIEEALARKFNLVVAS